MPEQNNTDGKLSDFLEKKLLSDENCSDAFVNMPEQTEMAINVVDGKIVIAFRKPVKFVTFNREQAFALADVLMSLACNIK